LIDLPRIQEVTVGNWTGNNFFSYLKLHKEAKSQSVDSKFLDFALRHFKSDLEKYGVSIDDYLADRLSGNTTNLFTLIPIQDIHLRYPNLAIGAGGKFANVVIILLIGALILIIACINYINMATARAGVRMKEVGMRKVMGSSKAQLVNQFFVESTVLSMISILIGLMLAILVLPYFNQFVQRSYALADLLSMRSMVVLFLLFAVVAVFSGAYPAIFISRTQLVTALKGGIPGRKNLSMRKVLVVFQFAVSIFLIASTFIIFKQVNLMQNEDTGINTSQTYAVKHIGTLGDNLNAYINRLKTNAGIKQVSVTNLLPSQSYIPDWTYKTVGEDTRSFSPDHLFADEQFMNTLDISLVQGRYFRADSKADSMSVVVNESFAKEIGGDVLNMKLTREGSG
jgi:putative ABC transport system permease protein